MFSSLQNLLLYIPVIGGFWHYFQPKTDEDYIARQLASMYYRGYLEHIASDICDQRFEDFEEKNPWEKKFSVRAIHILLTRSCTFPKVPIVENKTKEYWKEELTKFAKLNKTEKFDLESNQLSNRIEQIVRFSSGFLMLLTNLGLVSLGLFFILSLSKFLDFS